MKNAAGRTGSSRLCFTEKSDFLDLSRTAALIGEAAVEKLRSSCVAVAGLGGVGGYTVEALARSGVGRLVIIDCDVVEGSNFNRQIAAVKDFEGRKKTEAMADRIRCIGSGTQVVSMDMFITKENAAEIFSAGPDFVVDAVDNVTAKLALAQQCRDRGVGFVSCMGAGRRTDPTAFRAGDITETAGCGCGLARVMRHELKKRNIDGVRVVYSMQRPLEKSDGPPSSAGWVVGAAGLALAAEAVSVLTGLPVWR